MSFLSVVGTNVRVNGATDTNLGTYNMILTSLFAGQTKTANFTVVIIGCLFTNPTKPLVIYAFIGIPAIIKLEDLNDTTGLLIIN